jgi:hypothetical protein
MKIIKMKNLNKIISIIFLSVVCFIFTSLSHASWIDLLKGIEKKLESGGENLSQDKIEKGLKEALTIGSGNAVKKVSILDGYYGNHDIRIPLPDPVLKVEKLLRTFGCGSQVDAFGKSMNRAAEKAAPAACDLFCEAVKGMSFEDAKKILKGRDNEATLYLKDKTWGQLLETFKPMVHQAMGNVGVTRQYQTLEAKAGNIPLVGGTLGLDLDQYVSEGALNGIFFMLEKEEHKIREDPAARVTDLLKDVFGGNK